MTTSSWMTSVAEPALPVRRTGLQAPFFVGACLVLLLAGCGASDQEAASFQGSTMGTTWHVTMVPENGAAPDELGRRIQQALDAIDARMSTYKADSELNRLNEHPVGERFDVSEPLMEVLMLAAEIHRTTDGAFDPTVGPLVDLWGFGPSSRERHKPAAERIAALRARLGYDALSLEPDAGTAVRQRDIRIDLSAIAKGYAADRVAELLRDSGIHRYMVEVGGEMALAGHNPRDIPWQIALERPESGQRSVQQVVAMTDVGLATSGDYRNYFEEDGVRYSHTIDPRTGEPVHHRLASVTVAADTSARADALATAFMVMGTDETLAYAREHEVAVFTVNRTEASFEGVPSPAFEPYLPEAE